MITVADLHPDYVTVPKQTLRDTIRLFNECDWSAVCSEVSDLLDYFDLLLGESRHNDGQADG